MILSKQQKKKLIGGFTMAELLVSVSIIVVITVVVLFNQRTFDDQIALTNTVNEIEVEIRQAQVYGVSVREFSPNTQEFNVAYGVSFSRLMSGGDIKYITFADRGSLDGIYNGTNGATNCTFGGSSECLSVIGLSRSNRITDLCVILPNNSEQCIAQIRRIDVIFQRPDPEAILTFFNSGGNQVSFPTHIGARVEVTSPGGNTQNIYIYKTGQISVR